MMVYLDVVYNHFGPQLNYLHAYAEEFLYRPTHRPAGDPPSISRASTARSCASS